MTVFTVEITDPYQLAGITQARELKNSTLTPIKDKDGNITTPVESLPEYIATDQDYITFVFTTAAKSYATQFSLTDQAVQELQTKLDAANALRATVTPVVVTSVAVVATLSV